MSTSKHIRWENPPTQQVWSEKDYINLEKELVQLKEKTYETLQQYKQMCEFLEEEMVTKQQILQQLTHAQETNSKLEMKIKKLESAYKKSEKQLRAFQKSKLGRITMKYWAFRKRFLRS